MTLIHLDQIITENLAGLRLDQALAKLFPQYSRAQLQQWVKNGAVRVNQQKITKNKEPVLQGQQIEIRTTLVDTTDWQAQAIPLDILFEDAHLLVINKPAGLVVHPGAGNPASTLVNALLHYDKNLKKLPRAGLIHRLDKDTSGLLLVAKSLEALHFLSTQMQDHQIHRYYHAIALGDSQRQGSINLPIGRHPRLRIKMAVLDFGGKPAITHYRLLERLPNCSYLEIKLETGRTHQIRVHMAYIGHPLLGDPTYGRKIKNLHLTPDLLLSIENFPRQALHAKKLVFTHPVEKTIYTFESPLPADFQELLQTLRLNDLGREQR